MELPVQSPTPQSPVSDRKSSSYTIETKSLSYSYNRINGPYHELITWLFSRPKISTPKYIIKSVTLQADPGQITALVGPSGAGKTTLLEILAGKISPKRFSGHVLVNNDLMNPDIFRRVSGYVTQDDALFPLLTVEETLTYSALLRLPRGTKTLASQRAKFLMGELGLDHISGSRIGDGSSKYGISGGERRRVSIGAELVHDPKVLLIDEPTSGLDSSSALHVVSLLRSMAVCQRKTVLMTIHQPGSRILELIDRLVLLSHGVVAHNGSLQLLEASLSEAGHAIPRHVNVLEFAMDVVISDTAHHDVTVIEQATKSEERRLRNCISPPCANSRTGEVLILGERFCKNIFRTKELFATRVTQAVLVGCMLGTIYMNVHDDHRALQTKLGFFAFTLSFLLSSTTEGLPIFLQERRIFMRETSRGAYRVSSYVIANTVVFFPFLLLVGVLYSTSAYWLVGLRRDVDAFLYFALVVWLVVLMSNSFTACFSALVPNFIMGTSVIAGVMGSFFLFSGYFIAQDDIPRYWKFMHYLSLFKYPFEGFMINEYGGSGGGKCLETTGVGGECVLFGHQYLRQQGLKEYQRWTHLGVMFGFVVGYRVICFFILWYRSRGTRN